MKEYIKERAVAIANYIVDYNATVRQTAKKFGISKSTVHKDVTDRLEHINPSLAAQARVVGQLSVSYLENGRYLDFEELRLTPWLDPDAPAPAARVSFRVSARALFVLIAAVQVLIRFYREKVLDVFL